MSEVHQMSAMHSSNSKSKHIERDLVLGRYEVGHVIGKGGMGRVHYGLHVDLKQEVAIKYLQTSPRSRRDNADRRFHHEALMYASINHPNIVKFREVYKTKKGKLCIVMDYADDGDLQGKIK